MAVTSVFHVEGPFKIEMLTGASGAAWEELGVAGNDDSFSLTVSQLGRNLVSVTSGDEPEDRVMRGTRGVVTFTCVKWVEATKAKLFISPGGTVQGDANVVGRRLSDDGASGNHWIGFRIIPVDASGNDAISASRPKYTVSRCFFDDGDDASVQDFGNQDTRLVVQASAVRDSSGNIYAYATS